MPIQFCPKCKTILTQQNENLHCQNCQTTIQTKQTQTTIKEIVHNKKTTIDIIPEQNSGHDFNCPKCGNTKARLTDLGCMIGDENWIYLLECTKCGHGERIGNWC